MTQRDREETVVVVTTRTDGPTRAVASAIELMLAHRPSAAPIAIPIEPRRELSDASPALDGADVVVALDPVALARAASADVGLRVALWPAFGDAWPGSLRGAQAVLVPHASSVELAVARGADRADVVVIGPIAPESFAVALDRARARAELFSGATDLAPDVRVLVVPVAALASLDLTTTLTQLSLAAGPLMVVFDVEEDLVAAKALRAAAPRFGLRAALVSDREHARAVYGVADRVLARVDGPESFAALAGGAPLLVVEPRPRDVSVARALAADGLAAIADRVSMLAVTLDLALAQADASRAAVAALDIERGDERLRAAIASAKKRHPPRPTGLPRGLELLASDPVEAAMPALAPLLAAHAEKKQAESAAIDAELEELKKRIGG